MNLGIDLDKTLTAKPEFYKNLMHNWMLQTGNVYIITGRSPIDLGITMAELKVWGFKKDVHYSAVCVYPESYYYSKYIDDGAYIDMQGNVIERDLIKFRIGVWKANKCADLKIGVFFDDDTMFVSEMRKNGIYVLHADGNYVEKPLDKVEEVVQNNTMPKYLDQ